MNTTILIGRLTRDPELIRTVAGLGIVAFTLAVDSVYKKANGEKATIFIDVKYFERGEGDKHIENIIKYVKKGSQVCVNGRLNQYKYVSKDYVHKDSKEPAKITVTELIADGVEFLSRKEDRPAEADDGDPATETGEAPANTDLPE